MRIAVATISHETNTFTERPTTLSDFETATGDALLDTFGAARSLSGTVEQVESGDSANVAMVSVEGTGEGPGTDVFVADGKTNRHRDPAFFEEFGVDPAERAVFVLKSGYLSPAWKEMAARRLFALTAGDTNQRVETIPYEHVPRTIYPADPDTTFESDVRWSA